MREERSQEETRSPRAAVRVSPPLAWVSPPLASELGTWPSSELRREGFSGAAGPRVVGEACCSLLPLLRVWSPPHSSIYR